MSVILRYKKNRLLDNKSRFIICADLNSSLSHDIVQNRQQIQLADHELA